MDSVEVGRRGLGLGRWASLWLCCVVQRVCTFSLHVCVYRCVSSVTQSPEGSDGLVEQRGDILLLVAVRRAENHHAVLTEEYTLG